MIIDHASILLIIDRLILMRALLWGRGFFYITIDGTTIGYCNSIVLDYIVILLSSFICIFLRLFIQCLIRQG